MDEPGVGEYLKNAVDGLHMDGRLQQPALAMVTQDLELLMKEFIGWEIVSRIQEPIVSGEPN